MPRPAASSAARLMR